MIFIEIAAALLVVLSGLRDAFTWVDLIGASVAFLIIFGILHSSFKSQQSVSAAVLEILDCCEEQGIDIVTYWENL